MAYINFNAFEKYLRKLQLAQTVGQTGRQANRMPKHFSALLENVNKNKNQHVKSLITAFFNRRTINKI